VAERASSIKMVAIAEVGVPDWMGWQSWHPSGLLVSLSYLHFAPDNPEDDDQDRCEWVNVSFGTGSSGLCQTKSRESKMVVCVCVGVLLTHMCRCLSMYMTEH